jgi:thiol:disulfide interchange protein DsbD
MSLFRLCSLAPLVLTLIASFSYATPADKTSCPWEASTLQEEPLAIELLAEQTAIQAGHPLWLAIKIDHQPHWHSYWKNAGEAGMPLTIDWQLPPGLTFKQLHWPCPTRLEQSGMVGYGFEESIALLAEIDVAADLPVSTTPLELGAAVRWLACSDSACLPGETPLKLSLPITDALSAADQQHWELFANYRAAVPIKTWQPQAIRNGDVIELHLRLPHSSAHPLVQGTFFPATPRQIDDHTAAILIADPTVSDRYVVVLKDSPHALARTLQGVLLLEAADQTTTALELELPIHTTMDNASVALSDSNDSPIAIAESLPASIATIQTAPPLPVESTFEGGFAMALLLAFMGGFLLNLMPCVLPVISLKILNFMHLAGQDRLSTLKHGAAFTLGITLSFWLLAGSMLLIQSSGQFVGWGFQLQEPLFVGLLAGVLFLFGLNMFGIFEIGHSLTAIAGSAQNSLRKNSSELAGSFFSGVLTTAVATPCTGPFLGTAIGFAATLPPIQVLTIFTSLGAGMALPYMLLAAFPSWLQWLPKPGPWMSTFKEIVGFLMVATVLWLIWVFGAQTSSMAVSILLGGLFLLTIAAWIYGRYCSPQRTRYTRLLGGICVATFMIAAIGTIASSTSPLFADEPSTAIATSDSDWEPFSQARVDELHAKGIPVFIDFTAKWCLICQANHLVLTGDGVAKAMEKFKVVKMKADWTRKDAAIAQALRQWGRNAVPLYVLYGPNPGLPAQILPQVLTPEIVISALNNMSTP